VGNLPSARCPVPPVSGMDPNEAKMIYFCCGARPGTALRANLRPC